MADLARQTIELPAIHRTGFNLAVEPEMSVVRVQIRQHGDVKLFENMFGMNLPALNRVVISGQVTALCISPGEWMFSLPAKGYDAFLNAATKCLAGTLSMIVDMSHAALTLTLEGEKVCDTLNAYCPLDLRGGHFAAGHCARSSFGATEIILARIEPLKRYVLIIDQTMASYVFRLLANE